MKKIVLALVATLALTACNPSPDAYVGGDAPAASSGSNNFLWGAGGFLLGRMLSGSHNSHSTTVINRTYYHPAPRSVYRAPYRPSYRPSYRSSWSSGSSWSRPSYRSSYSYRSSSFGRRR